MPDAIQRLFDTPLPVTGPNGGAVPIAISNIATTLYHNAAVTSLILVKGSSTGVYGGFVSNPSTTAMAYLQCFNAASVGAVTLGTTVPQDVFHVPPMSAYGDKYSNSVPYPLGLVIAATTDVNNATLVSNALKASLYIS